MTLSDHTDGVGYAMAFTGEWGTIRPKRWDA